MKKFLSGVLIAASTLMFSACDSDQISQNESQIILEAPASSFQQMKYQDPAANLEITYNLYLPEDYHEGNLYPLVIFIADASCAGEDPIKSLTQGKGALVWASKDWQSKNECIVAVPTYPEVILDDHGSYTTTDYIELTRRFILDLEEKYLIDPARIYGTGQSMGCMTTMLLAAKYPDLYTAIMLVDGQWDINQLKGLESQKFIYFAAEDDDRAFKGLNEVSEMFEKDQVEFARAEWDGKSTSEELSKSAEDLFSQNRNANFVTWKTGSIEPKSMGNQASYHMGSFDYAYSSKEAMEWIFNQRK